MTRDKMPTTMSQHLTDTDIGSLFGLEMDSGADTSPVSVVGILCSKCHGRGNFIGWSGRIVGKCFACDGSGLSKTMLGQPEPGTAVDVSAIVTAFEAARSNGIKTPRLRLADFVFSRAPDTGRNAGSIYVKAKVGNEYLGKVTDGRFLPIRTCDDVTRDQVISVASAPHEAAKAYGMRTGNCSCCGRELTNGLSVELGIGPICRDKYGW